MRGLLRVLGNRNANAEGREAWVRAQARRLSKGARVLDVGAGAAPYRKYFGHCEYRTHDFGLEPSTMGSYTTLDYQSDILAIPVEDGSYDGVICTEVLEHVPEPSRALLEIGRILKVGGIALISAPLGSRLHQLPYHYYGGFTPQWYQRFLPQAWFAIESIEPNGGFFAHFAQEAQKFHALLDPRRMRSGPIARMSTALLWLGMAPTCRVILPKTAVALDGLDLESEGTVGYHVVARRIDGAAQKGLADLVCP